MKAWRRDYCTCVEVRNYDPQEAADRLKCRVRFLTDNAKKLPHQKIGQSIAFCNCELALIQALYSVMPADLLAEAFGDDEPERRDAEPEPAPVASLASIKPAPKPGRRAS